VARIRAVLATKYVTRFEVCSERRDISWLGARHRHALPARHGKWVTFFGVSDGRVSSPAIQTFGCAELHVQALWKAVDTRVSSRFGYRGRAMGRSFTRGHPPHLGIATILSAGAFIIAGCGSGGSSSSTVSASSATVSAKHEPGYGNVLVDSAGQPVYMLTSDPSGRSRCSGSCAKSWPPLTAKGSPTAGPGADGSLLSTFARSDGTKQVEYNHHALYTYTGSGLVAGEGVASNGGIFYLVAPSGKPVTRTTAGHY
jgi:predicted lipoprotein with Yx(FWY)xxD motif